MDRRESSELVETEAPPSTTRPRHGAAAFEEPKPRNLLDWIAHRLEGGGVGVPCQIMLDLSQVLSEAERQELPGVVHDFYARPDTFDITAGLDASLVTRAWLRLFALVGRQADIADVTPGFEGYPVGQRIYEDAAGRVHWDRYVEVRGAWRRLFLARMSGSRGTMRETFVVYGIPFPLTFRATVEEGALVLTLQRRWSSPTSWFSRVVYRTAASDTGTTTHGEFRVPLLGFYARTEFRAAR